jgi:hypothetical protein
VPGKPAATSTAPATLTGTRIVGIFPSGSTFEAMYQQQAKDFEAATGIKLEYSSVPFENLMDREMTLVRAQSSEIDIFGTHYAQIGEPTSKAGKPPTRIWERCSLRRFDSKTPRLRAWLAICRPTATSASRATGSG